MNDSGWKADAKDGRPPHRLQGRDQPGDSDMATITQHAVGTFCWPELATIDQPRARSFYTQLFGWEVREQDMGEAGTYTLLRKDDRDVGALYQLSKDQREQGVPPHWLSYVAVDSADRAAEQAVRLGAKPIMAPLDVYDIGRMAVLEDPQGAVFALWQAKKHIGAGVLDEIGSLCWTELQTRDTAAARRFYGGLFGWAVEEMPMGPATYTLFKRDHKPAGGMMAIAPLMGPMPPNWLVYFSVDDCDTTVAKAIMAGGKVVVAPQSAPGVGRYAVMTDPQGAHFAMLAKEKQG